MKSPVIKKNVKVNAELKTLSDYALILEEINGYSNKEARQKALESFGEPLFEELLRRNTELFTSGSIILQ